jgi:hypothetical protein
MPLPYNESTVRSPQEMVRLMTTDYNPFRYDVTEAFSKLLVHGRSLLFYQRPDYATLEQSFRTLAQRNGYILRRATCLDALRYLTPMKEPDCSLPSDYKDNDWCEDNGYEPQTAISQGTLSCGSPKGSSGCNTWPRCLHCRCDRRSQHELVHLISNPLFTDHWQQETCDLEWETTRRACEKHSTVENDSREHQEWP